MSESNPDRSVCTCSGDPGYVDPDCPTHGPESGFAPVTVRYREQAVERLARSLAKLDGFGDHATAFAVGAVPKYTDNAEKILDALTESSR